MVQFVTINFFLGFLQFLLGFSKVPVFFCVTLYITAQSYSFTYQFTLKQHVSAAIRPSSGQYRTYKRYNNVSTQWDHISFFSNC